MKFGHTLTLKPFPSKRPCHSAASAIASQLTSDPSIEPDATGAIPSRAPRRGFREFDLYASLTSAQQSCTGGGSKLEHRPDVAAQPIAARDAVRITSPRDHLTNPGEYD